jgi:hypothetical protein
MALRTSKTPVAIVSTAEPVTVAVTEEPIRERAYDLYEQRGSGGPPRRQQHKVTHVTDARWTIL